MLTFAEYITESVEDYNQFLQYGGRGKLKITKDLYFYKSINPRALPLWTISTKEADVQKSVDKDIKELGRKKSFKDRIGEMKLSKYPKGMYEYSMHTRKGPNGDQFEALTLPLGRTDFFVLDRYVVLKLYKEGVIKFN